MRENTDQKNSEYGHFSRSGASLLHCLILLEYHLKPNKQKQSFLKCWKKYSNERRNLGYKKDTGAFLDGHTKATHKAEKTKFFGMDFLSRYEQISR